MNDYSKAESTETMANLHDRNTLDRSRVTVTPTATDQDRGPDDQPAHPAYLVNLAAHQARVANFLTDLVTAGIEGYEYIEPTPGIGLRNRWYGDVYNDDHFALVVTLNHDSDLVSTAPLAIISGAYDPKAIQYFYLNQDGEFAALIAHLARKQPARGLATNFRNN